MRDMSQEGGFSLLEALVAIAILAFGVLAIVAMLETAYMGGRVSKDYTMATSFAAEMMDTIRQQVVETKGANASRLYTFDNDAGSAIVMDTRNAAPASNPGLDAYNDWKFIIESNISGGYGIVEITENEPDVADNIVVSVRVLWPTIGPFHREVELQTVLYPQL